MIPNPAEVVRRQWTLTGIYRMIATIIGVVALLALVGGITFATSLSAVEGWRRDEVLFSLFFSFIAAGGLALVAWLLFAFSRPLARHAAAYPRSVPCPKCFYALEGLVEPKCPECGLDLTAEFMPPGGLRPGPESVPQALIRHRLVFIPIVRLGAVIMAVPLGGVLIPLVMIIFEAAQWGDNPFEEPGYVFTWLWWLVTTAFVISAIFFPRLWVMWLVPRPSGAQRQVFAADPSASQGGVLAGTSGTPQPSDPARIDPSEVAAETAVADPPTTTVEPRPGANPG